MNCNICTKRSTRWRICYKCRNAWCEECNDQMMSRGTPIQRPSPLHGKIEYKCPYCRTGFIKGSRFITPVTHKTSKACIIM